VDLLEEFAGDECAAGPVDLGPRREELADFFEAWAFFERASCWRAAWKDFAAAAVRKALRLRFPASSYQSAKNFFVVRCDCLNFRGSFHIWTA